jgi:hypothetical protein
MIIEDLRWWFQNSEQELGMKGASFESSFGESPFDNPGLNEKQLKSVARERKIRSILSSLSVFDVRVLWLCYSSHSCYRVPANIDRTKLANILCYILMAKSKEDKRLVAKWIDDAHSHYNDSKDIYIALAKEQFIDAKNGSRHKTALAINRNKSIGVTRYQRIKLEIEVWRSEFCTIGGVNE